MVLINSQRSRRVLFLFFIFIFPSLRKNNVELKELTNDVGEENADQACQLSPQHSWHLVDLVCLQTQAAQHLSTHPTR